MRIDTVELSDIPRLIQLAVECGLSPWSENDYRDELKRPDSVMLRVGNQSKECCGFLVGRIVQGSTESDSWTEAEIYNIGVSSAAQGNGFGRRLLVSFLDQCRRRNADSVWLEVRANNLKAIGFYRTFGFEEVTRRPRFYRDPQDDAIVMALQLDPLERNDKT